MPAVTSWKSASGTPFATKRGAQCEIAASTRGSFLVSTTADMVRLQSNISFPRKQAKTSFGESQAGIQYIEM